MAGEPAQVCKVLAMTAPMSKRGTGTCPSNPTLGEQGQADSSGSLAS